MVCWRQAAFGKHEWQLPPHACPHPDATERCAVFGAALLEGKVLPAMQGTLPGGGEPSYAQALD